MFIFYCLYSYVSEKVGVLIYKRKGRGFLIYKRKGRGSGCASGAVDRSAV